MSDMVNIKILAENVETIGELRRVLEPFTDETQLLTALEHKVVPCTTVGIQKCPDELWRLVFGEV